MQDAYASLALAECPLVLGRRMLPFSLWHAHVLEAFASPLLDGRDADAEDILVAAWVCSRDYKESTEWLRNRRSQIGDDCRQWGASVTTEQLNEAGELVRKYITQHTYTPYRHGATGDESALPWTLGYLWLILKEQGGRFDIEEAWNTPVNMAVAVCAMRAISSGDSTYFTESMEEGLREARASARAVKGADNGNG